MDRINEIALTFLLNAVWQIIVVTLAASICARLLRDAPARYRHALWVAALMLSIALPLWSLYSLRRDSTESFSPSPTTTATPRESSAAAAAPNLTGQPAGSAVVREGLLSLKTILQQRRQTLPNLPSITLALVIAYAIFFLYRLNTLRRAWKLTRDIRRSAYGRAIPDEMRRVAEQCRVLFSLKDVRIRCSAKVDAPVTIGWHEPIIILPESFFATFPTETLASVLGHEMAHIARRDFALNLVYEFLRLPISFHPLASLAARQINRTRELACDELVVGRVLAADAYARALVRVASSLTTPADHAYSLGVFDADILEERIMRLIEKRGPLSARARRCLMAASCSLLLTTTLAASVFSLGLHAVEYENGLTQEQTVRDQVDAAEKIRAFTSANAVERAAAACMLGRRRAVEAIPSLIQMLGDDTAIEPVQCWGESGSWSPALDTFKQASPGEEAAIALAAMGQLAVEPLVAALGHANASVRRNAAWAIGEVRAGRVAKREAAVEPLRSALSDGDEWVRMAAARALGEIRDERAVENLMPALSDGSGNVRELVAWALGEMKEKRAVQSLGVMLLKDEQAGARRMAAWALGEIRDPKAVESLNAALNDPDPPVREKAKWALSEIQE